MGKIIFVDIDETICLTPDHPREYKKAKPIYENIDKVNTLYDQGNTIIYWTARGSRSGIDWYDLTKQQLEDWEQSITIFVATSHTMICLLKIRV